MVFTALKVGAITDVPNTAPTMPIPTPASVTQIGTGSTAPKVSGITDVGIQHLLCALQHLHLRPRIARGRLLPRQGNPTHDGKGQIPDTCDRESVLREEGEKRFRLSEGVKGEERTKNKLSKLYDRSCSVG